jgi:hypothetical protein
MLIGALPQQAAKEDGDQSAFFPIVEIPTLFDSHICPIQNLDFTYYL